jgi:glutathione peroxidase
MSGLRNLQAQMLSGGAFDPKTLEGKLVLVVNTASECGFTPQYAGLEALHRKYSDKGLAVLGFPCNQFGAQEPGDAKEIVLFCEKNYGVSFPMFSKIEVNGEDAHPLYQWLRSEKEGPRGADIDWNFTKFLIGRDGQVLERWAPATKPEKLAGDIEKALA